MEWPEILREIRKGLDDPDYVDGEAAFQEIDMIINSYYEGKKYCRHFDLNTLPTM